MISRGSVSLRAARQDMGLSASGGLKVIEVRERTGSSSYSLKSLRGTIACRSSKQETGYYRENYNRGTSCRTNYSEGNIFGVDNDHVCYLQANTYASGYCFTENDTLSGYSFVGRAPSGFVQFDIAYTQPTPVACQIEIIGWSTGYFAGSPLYYHSNLNTGFNERWQLNLNGAHSYLTVCLQALGVGDIEAKINISKVRVWQ